MSIHHLHPLRTLTYLHLHASTESTAQSLLREFVLDQSIPQRDGYLCIRELIKERGLLRMQDTELLPLCKEIVQACPEEVEAIRRGKNKVIMRLVGETLRRAKGRADPEHVQRLLTELTSVETASTQ